MPLCSISLPDFSIAHMTENIKLTVTGCLKIDVPSCCRRVQTSIELEDLVRTWNLWIARTGSCYFNVEISVDGFGVQKDQVDHIRDLLLGFEV